MASADSVSMFPQAQEGQKRLVIHLEPKDNEDAFKVELIPGRVEKVDSVNHHFIGGKIQKKTLDGWGYEYYMVSLQKGGVASTRMGLGDETNLVDKFVSSKPKMIRYNSKLPIVVYLPEEAELHYQLWTTSGKESNVGIAKEE